MKKRNYLYVPVLLGLAGLIEGCATIQKSGTMLYERTIDRSGNLLQERFVLNGRGKEVEEIYRRFDQIYEQSSKKIYGPDSSRFNGNSSKRSPGKI